MMDSWVAAEHGSSEQCSLSIPCSAKHPGARVLAKDSLVIKRAFCGCPGLSNKTFSVNPISYIYQSFQLFALFLRVRRKSFFFKLLPLRSSVQFLRFFIVVSLQFFSCSSSLQFFLAVRPQTGSNENCSDKIVFLFCKSLQSLQCRLPTCSQATFRETLLIIKISSIQCV